MQSLEDEYYAKIYSMQSKYLSNQSVNDVILNEKQKEAYKKMISGKSIFLTGPGGVGKCLGRDTPVLMYDGSIKKVQDIQTGEYLMGDDSKPRHVESICKGVENLYRVTTVKGDSYVVNSSHILTFRTKQCIRYKKYKGYVLTWGDIDGIIKHIQFKTKKECHKYINDNTFPKLVDLPVKFCLDKVTSKYWSEYFMGVYASIEFNKTELPYDPYLIGLWLGIGIPNKPDIADTDTNILEWLNNNLKQYGFYLSKNNDNISYSFIQKDHKENHPFTSFLKKYNLYNNKNIPKIYKINSRKNRLQLLAGLIDSNGYLTKDSYEITQKSKQLSDDIVYLCRSLGFTATIKECVTSCIYSSEKVEHYKIIISGYIDKIPVLLTKKKATIRNQNKNNLVSNINIDCIGEGEYYGFMIGGNHRFVLGNFIITHNTKLIKLFAEEFSHIKSIGLTSTTGTSALIIGGTTLHSFTGIKLGTSSAQVLAAQIMSKPYLRKRWKDLQVLIIDEVSMLTPILFDKLEEIARTIRRNDAPFGGIQLILTGDFCQLPCVEGDEFCFQSRTWNRCVEEVVYLKQILRQEDQEFRMMLNKVRMGVVDEMVKQALSSRIGKELTNEFGIKPTKLFPLKANVEKMNEEELDKLGDVEFRRYNMEITFYPEVKNKQYALEKFRKNNVAPEELELAIGAQVMLTFNIDLPSGLANGSRGVVTEFVDDFPKVTFLNGASRVIDYNVWDVEENGQKIMRAIQIPLRVAYALTIHKIQGATLDYASIDLENIFEHGQAYVALSRVTKLEGLSIMRVDYDKIKAHPEATRYYKRLEEMEDYNTTSDYS